MTLPTVARLGLTLLLGWCAAQACVALHTPIPWMLGPMLATAAAAVGGLQPLSALRLRNAGQWTIGTALGLYFTPQVLTLVAGLWWAVALAVAWALGLGWGFGRWLQARHGEELGSTRAQQAATGYFASSIGGASEMTLLAEREGARTDLVAAAHSVRILMVTLLVPVSITLSGWHGMDATPPGIRSVHWPGLAGLAVLTGLGGWVLQRLGRANPWFMGALVVSMGLTMASVPLSGLPPWLTNAAQLVIGISLGVRFNPGFLKLAPRWLVSVGLGTLGMIVLSVAFGLGVAWLTGLHPATAILATAPGGIAEMAITAKVLQLGVPVVTAFQTCRLVAVLLLVEPVFRWTQKFRDSRPAGR